MYTWAIMGMAHFWSKSQSSGNEDAELRWAKVHTSQSSTSSIKSILKRQQPHHEQNKPHKKKNVTFDTVAVYYFPSVHGGGFASGMAPHHTHMQYFSISEHDDEQRH
jgi:hypothetical protein